MERGMGRGMDGILECGVEGGIKKAPAPPAGADAEIISLCAVGSGLIRDLTAAVEGEPGETGEAEKADGGRLGDFRIAFRIAE